jgi:hypothetical protein
MTLIHSARPPQSIHQILADGKVIYSGADWTHAFLEAAFHPAYHYIVHLENGKSGACWGPIVTTLAGQGPGFPLFLPPMEATT